MSYDLREMVYRILSHERVIEFVGGYGLSKQDLDEVANSIASEIREHMGYETFDRERSKIEYLVKIMAIKIRKKAEEKGVDIPFGDLYDVLDSVIGDLFGD